MLPAWLIPEATSCSSVKCLLLCLYLFPRVSVEVGSTCRSETALPQIKPSEVAALPRVPYRLTEGETIPPFVLLPIAGIVQGQVGATWSSGRGWNEEILKVPPNPSHCEGSAQLLTALWLQLGIPPGDGHRSGTVTPTITEGQGKLSGIRQSQCASLSSVIQLFAVF